MRTSKIKIDPETGLPELPEGCFWEVRQEPHPLYDWPTLELLLVFPKEGQLDALDARIETFWSSAAEDVETKHIVKTAKYLYAMYSDQLQREADLKRVSKFVGKYPPKKL